jgi:hypothetical protein
MTATVKPPPGPSWAAIYGSNNVCLGHAVLRYGALGFEVFDTDTRSIGFFQTLADATAALASLAVPS